MAQKAVAMVAFLRNLFVPESLPPATTGEPERAGSAGFARLLFAPEPLPEEPPPPRREGPGALEILFAPEVLPEEEAAPRRRGHWLAWLLEPENLDRS